MFKEEKTGLYRKLIEKMYVKKRNSFLYFFSCRIYFSGDFCAHRAVKLLLLMIITIIIFIIIILLLLFLPKVNA